MKTQRRRLVKALFCILAVLIAAEIFLRQYYGFCDAVLMREDSDYEYIAQPNQNRFRFRRHIRYNKYSMRSDEVDTSATKILGFGDSIINGGTLTDQDSLITTVLSQKLTDACFKKIQILNISAGSWGPDNCYEYLKKTGHFNAKCMLLFVSSHDAYDNMTFEKVVGFDPGFPSKQYKLALVELLERYVFPQLGIGGGKTRKTVGELGINKKVAGSKFNSGFESLLKYARMNNMYFAIVLHADAGEIKSKMYNNQGKQIINFAQRNDVPLVGDLNIGLASSDYRDNIHLNESGQRKISEMLLPWITKQFAGLFEVTSKVK